MARNSAPKKPAGVAVRRLRVEAVAREVGLSPRQLARLVKKGVPGVQRSASQYHWDWRAYPETLAWIRDQKKFRKGRRRGKPKRKIRMSTAERFGCAVSRMRHKWQEPIRLAIAKGSESELNEFITFAFQLRMFSSLVERWSSGRLQHGHLPEDSTQFWGLEE